MRSRPTVVQSLFSRRLIPSLKQVEVRHLLPNRFSVLTCTFFAPQFLTALSHGSLLSIPPRSMSFLLALPLLYAEASSLHPDIGAAKSAAAR